MHSQRQEPRFRRLSENNSIDSNDDNNYEIIIRIMTVRIMIIIIIMIGIRTIRIITQKDN